MNAKGLHMIGQPADAVVQAAVQFVVSVNRRQDAVCIRQNPGGNVIIGQAGADQPIPGRQRDHQAVSLLLSAKDTAGYPSAVTPT